MEGRSRRSGVAVAFQVDVAFVIGTAHSVEGFISRSHSGNKCGRSGVRMPPQSCSTNKGHQLLILCPKQIHILTRQTVWDGWEGGCDGASACRTERGGGGGGKTAGRANTTARAQEGERNRQRWAIVVRQFGDRKANPLADQSSTSKTSQKRC